MGTIPFVIRGYLNSNLYNLQRLDLVIGVPWSNEQHYYRRRRTMIIVVEVVLLVLFTYLAWRAFTARQWQRATLLSTATGLLAIAIIRGTGAPDVAISEFGVGVVLLAIAILYGVNQLRRYFLKTSNVGDSQANDL